MIRPTKPRRKYSLIHDEAHPRLLPSKNDTFYRCCFFKICQLYQHDKQFEPVLRVLVRLKFFYVISFPTMEILGISFSYRIWATGTLLKAFNKSLTFEKWTIGLVVLGSNSFVAVIQFISDCFNDKRSNIIVM